MQQPAAAEADSPKRAQDGIGAVIHLEGQPGQRQASPGQVLPEIAEQFRALKNAQQGTFDAHVFSAFPIEPAALADLSGVLEKRFGRKLNLQVELQPELIGGIRVVVGDEVLDTSVKARLEQMKVALTA